MIYFSEIKGKKVITEDNIEVGRLEDIIFLASESPSVTKLVIRDAFKKKLIIPILYLKRINRNIILIKEYTGSELEENELHLVKNLLDKQIIDLKGSKVVRVNDVAIQDKRELYIAGVDVGILGILRWLKIEDILNKLLWSFNIKLMSQFLSWGDIQPLELVHGQVRLKKKEEKLEKIRPADLAGYLDKTNVANARRFLRILDEKKAAEVIGKLNINYQASLFRHFKPERAAKFLNYILPDDAVDILLTLSSKKRQEIMNFLPAEKKVEFERLLKLSSTTIGSLLTTEFLSVEPDNLVSEVMAKIKKEAGDFPYLTPIYVINKNKQLTGVFNLHELLLQDSDTPIYKFMIQDVVVLHLTTPIEIALKRMVRYRLQAIPVIDENKRILGIVTVLSVIELFAGKII